MDNIPTFTPPPAAKRSENACHFHPDEPAVEHCARCGKPICSDCVDKYQVDGGKYAGEPICYDCCDVLVRENVSQLKKQRRTIIFQYLFTALGMAFGLIISTAILVPELEIEMAWLSHLICALVGGCLWTFVKNIGLIFANTIRNFSNGAWLGGIFWLIIDTLKAIFIAIWGTIKKIVYYTKYIIQTSGFIKSDTTALREMADYMAYTQIMSRNQGVDIETLMAEGNELAGNTYAQAVKTNGEQAAQDSVRNAAVSFNEHGEIVRGFAG